MSDLQLALLALGALIIIAVIVFNWWQERKLRNEAAERFEEPQRDALMDDFQIDTEAVLKHEAATRKTDFDTMPAPSYKTAFSGTEDDPAYENPIADAASAVEEFEQDMAVPVEEEAATSQAYSADFEPDWAESNYIATESASTEELLEEAGLDETPQSKFWTDNISAAEPAAAIEEAVPTHEPASKVTDSKITEEYAALPPAINQHIDLIAVLYLPTPANGAVLREFLVSLVDIDKPVHAYGLDQDGVWRLLTREQESVDFIRAACSLQLADRGGPVSGMTLNRFQQAVDTLGHSLKAQVEWLGGTDPLSYASELDEFCLDVDKLVGFHLVSGASGPFTGTKFRGLAEASGLVLREDGAFHYEADNGQQLFSIVNVDNHPFSLDMLRTAVIRGITFQLDIPRVKNCAEVFNHMVLAAKQMENSLSGELVDDNQRALAEPQIEKIRQQLKMIHAKMVTRGIVPGSPSALRLFS